MTEQESRRLLDCLCGWLAPEELTAQEKCELNRLLDEVSGAGEDRLKAEEATVAAPAPTLHKLPAG